MDIDDLDLYYEDCVIGGPGSFVVAIKDRDKFKEAIRTFGLNVLCRSQQIPLRNCRVDLSQCCRQTIEA